MPSLLQQSIFVIILISTVDGNPFRRWPIGLSSGGYNNILVAINENVNASHQFHMLKQIEAHIGDFSRAMYQATKKKLFIRNVTILVPQSWNGSYTAAGREAFQFANILIDEANPATGNTPYVARSLPECGKPGDYMHLTPEYIEHEFINQYGTPGNVLLHEWAHLRWGLGDEYAHRERGESAFYGNGAPVRCSKDVKGTSSRVENGQHIKGCIMDPKTHLPTETCYFTPFSGTISVMYDQKNSSKDGFCDEHNHNADAPNEQNKLCDGKSSWEVFNEHQNFKGPHVRLDETPTVTIVQQATSNKIVLVLDVSGSMGTQDKGAPARRIERLGSDASQYITNVISDGTYVGIVKFSSGASLVKPLTLIDNERNDLANSVHFSAGGSTCIGCGILRAIEVLKNAGSVRGGNIIVISDGIDGNPRKLAEAEDKLRITGSVLDAILYTVNADDVLRDLAKQSSGSIYFEEGGSTDLIQALVEIESARTSSTSFTPVQIYLNTVITKVASSRNVTFNIDTTIGRETKVTVTYQTGITGDQVDLFLHSPGRTTVGNAILDPIGRTVSIEIKGIAEPGEWILEIVNMGDIDVHSQVLVLSKQFNAANRPITAKAFVSRDSVDFMGSSLFLKIVAEVKKGYNPVLGATVVARVTAAGGGLVENIVLNDNGLGADVIKRDGYYSGIFVSYTINGKYSVKVDVSTVDGKVNVLVGSQGANANQDFLDTSSIPVGAFDRTTSGGFFTVQNFDGTDMFPPAQIKDLSLKLINNRDSTIQLEWTAMGEDFDQNGPATGYTLRCCETSKLLREKFDNCREITDADVIAGELSEPLEPYTLQSITIRLTVSMSNKTYYFGLKVVDDSGQWSPLSNIISAGVYNLEDPYPGAVTTNTLGLQLNEISNDQGLPIVILGLSMGITMILFVIGSVLIARCLRSRLKVRYMADDSPESHIVADNANVVDDTAKGHQAYVGV